MWKLAGFKRGSRWCANRWLSVSVLLVVLDRMASGPRYVLTLRKYEVARVSPHRRRLGSNQGRILRQLPKLPQDFLSRKRFPRGSRGRRPGQFDTGHVDGRGWVFTCQRQSPAVAGKRVLNYGGDAPSCACKC